MYFPFVVGRLEFELPSTPDLRVLWATNCDRAGGTAKAREGVEHVR